MAVFWAVAPCSMVEVYQRFKGPCYLHHQGIHRPHNGGSKDLCNVSKLLPYHTTRRYNPEYSHLRTRSRENLKSYQEENFVHLRRVIQFVPPLSLSALLPLGMGQRVVSKTKRETGKKLKQRKYQSGETARWKASVCVCVQMALVPAAGARHGCYPSGTSQTLMWHSRLCRVLPESGLTLSQHSITTASFKNPCLHCTQHVVLLFDSREDIWD
jgi:hypothetical protein